MVNQYRHFASGFGQPHRHTGVVPVGSYTVMGGAGNAVGTEEFRAAAGPAGWRYFSTVDTREPEPHREVIDLVVDGASRPVRVRIDTGSHAILLEAWGESLSAPTNADEGAPLPAPETDRDFIGDLGVGTPLLAWVHLDGPAFGTLWLHRVAGCYAVCARILSEGGGDGIVYGLISHGAPLTERTHVIEELFARNGHRNAPLFPKPPDAVIHHNNAPVPGTAPVYESGEARELLSFLPAVTGDGFDEWFDEVTDHRRVREALAISRERMVSRREL